MYAIDFLRMEKLRSFNKNLNFNDRSESKLSSEKVNKVFKGSLPNTLVMGEGKQYSGFIINNAIDGKFMYIGYKNGSLGVMEKSFQGKASTILYVLIYSRSL